MKKQSPGKSAHRRSGGLARGKDAVAAYTPARSDTTDRTEAEVSTRSFRSLAERGKDIKERTAQRVRDKVDLPSERKRQMYLEQSLDEEDKVTPKHSELTSSYYQVHTNQASSHSGSAPGSIVSTGASPFNEADSHVSLKPLYGVFPLSDRQLFPPRRASSTGWQVGLRQYDDHGRVVHDSLLEEPCVSPVTRRPYGRPAGSRKSSTTESSEAVESDKEVEGVLNETAAHVNPNNSKGAGNSTGVLSLSMPSVDSKDADTRHSSHNTVGSNHRSSNRHYEGNFVLSESETHFANLPVSKKEQAACSAAVPKMLKKFRKVSHSVITAQRGLAPHQGAVKKSHYTLPVLAPVSPEEQNRYFGLPAKNLFFGTYKQLCSQGMLLQGGYEELREIVSEPYAANLLTASMISLRNSGVLSPRVEGGSLESSKKMESAWTDEVVPAEGRCGHEAMVDGGLMHGGASEHRACTAPTQRTTDATHPALHAHSLGPVATAAAVSLGASSSTHLPAAVLGMGDDSHVYADGPELLHSSSQLASYDPVGGTEATGDDSEAAAKGFQKTAERGSKEESPLAREGGGGQAQRATCGRSNILLSQLSLENTTTVSEYNPLTDPAVAWDEYSASHHANSNYGADVPESMLSRDSPSLSRQQRLRQRRAANALSEGSRRLDTPLEDDNLLSSSTYGSGSPRAIFLAGCLDQGLPPITLALLRKKVAPNLEIPHMGIGDTIASILAPCISSLPYLQTVNLNDNNLEDEGLCDLISAIAEHEDVRILDIGKNVMGSKASLALASFVGNSQCKLLCLRMSDADIDDGECASFVEVLMRNRHLQELDMSKNLLGKDENLNAVQPDVITGGESLAELINDGNCPLQILNLHWNMIRLEGAVVLCDSLRNSRTLLNVDLSYNALGRTAADVLGSALIDNTSLKVLNVANNGIDALGTFTLLVGARECKTLHFLNVDGNPVGEQGGRMLMRLAVSDGHRLTVSAQNCDFGIKTAEKKFDVGSPFGFFELDLSIPYERAIMAEVIYMSAVDPSLMLHSLTYQVSIMNPTFEPLNLERIEQEVDVTTFTMNEKQERHYQESMATLSQLNNDRLLEISQRYEELHNEQYRGTFRVKHITDILNALHVRLPHEMLHDVVRGVDPYELGHVNIREFVQYLLTRGMVAKSRLFDLMHRTVFMVVGERPRSGKTVRDVYFPPSYGKVKLRVEDGFLSPKSAKPLSRTQCNHAIKAATACTLPLPLLQYAASSGKLYYEEARMLYSELMKRSEDSVDAVAKLLARMTDTRDAMLLLKSVIGNDVILTRRLKQLLGKAYYPLVGVHGGYYALDLSFEADRKCLQLLLAHSTQCGKARKYGIIDSATSAAQGSAPMPATAVTTVRSRPGTAKGKRGGGGSRPSSSGGRMSSRAAEATTSAFELGDTSQLGDWSCFRNVIFGKGIEYNGLFGEELPSDFSLCPFYFYPMPIKGKLEFDFISTERPWRAPPSPALDSLVIDCLLLSRLLSEEKVDIVATRQRASNKACKRLIISSGSAEGVFKVDTGRALMVAEHCRNIQASLQTGDRKKSLEKSTKRELIKNEAPPSSKNDGRRGARKARGINGGAGSPISKDAAGGGLASASSDSMDSNNSLRPRSPGKTSGGSGGTAGGGGMFSQMKRAEDAGKNTAKQAPTLTQKQKEEIMRFKLPRNQHLNISSKQGWRKRMYECMVETRGSEEFRSQCVLECLESELLHVWICCAHLCVVLQYFKCGLVPKSCCGSYRVELVVLLFHRIVDLHNFSLILSVLSSEEQAALHVRVGVLNIFNPCQPEGCYVLDLARWEERQLSKLLLHITASEPGSEDGSNRINKSYCAEWGAVPPSAGSWDSARCMDILAGRNTEKGAF